MAQGPNGARKPQIVIPACSQRESRSTAGFLDARLRGHDGLSSNPATTLILTLYSQFHAAIQPQEVPFLLRLGKGIYANAPRARDKSCVGDAQRYWSLS